MYMYTYIHLRDPHGAGGRAPLGRGRAQVAGGPFSITRITITITITIAITIAITIVVLLYMCTPLLLQLAQVAGGPIHASVCVYYFVLLFVFMCLSCFYLFYFVECVCMYIYIYMYTH